MVSLIDFGIGMIAWFIIIGMHELGHYVTYRVHGIIPKVSLNGLNVEMDTDAKLTETQENQIYMGGIVCGSIGLLLYIGLFDLSIFYICLFIGFYIIGCEHDIKAMLKWEDKDDGFEH